VGAEDIHQTHLRRQGAQKMPNGGRRLFCWPLWPPHGPIDDEPLAASPGWLAANQGEVIRGGQWQNVASRVGEGPHQKALLLSLAIPGCSKNGHDDGGSQVSQHILSIPPVPLRLLLLLIFLTPTDFHPRTAAAMAPSSGRPMGLPGRHRRGRRPVAHYSFSR
jgi:hypothetical protein